MDARENVERAQRRKKHHHSQKSFSATTVQAKRNRGRNQVWEQRRTTKFLFPKQRITLSRLPPPPNGVNNPRKTDANRTIDRDKGKIRVLHEPR